MPTVAEVLRRFGPAYLAKFGAKTPRHQRDVLGLISRCRTGELGTLVYWCEHCEARHHIGRSCGNRHCPNCQQTKTRTWLQCQIANLLPCPYFLLTFTIPASLRPFVRSHQSVCYQALFRASSETIRALAADPRYLGSSDCGMLGVLHTWGRTLTYHPHVHYVVPGGALSADGKQWLSSGVAFFIPVRAASMIYREKFREEMRKAGLLEQIPASVWKEAWVVHSKAVGDGRRAMKYLAPYVYRVAISNSRIETIEYTPDGQGWVTFTYRQSGSNRTRRMKVSGFEFLRRFLQHVLPPGFQKVRYYGFLSARRRDQIEHVRWLATLAQGKVYELTSLPAQPEPAAPPNCPKCGTVMTLVAILQRSIVQTALVPRPVIIDTS
jgi:hypothetical protein